MQGVVDEEPTPPDKEKAPPVEEKRESLAAALRRRTAFEATKRQARAELESLAAARPDEAGQVLAETVAEHLGLCDLERRTPDWLYRMGRRATREAMTAYDYIEAYPNVAHEWIDWLGTEKNIAPESEKEEQEWYELEQEWNNAKKAAEEVRRRHPVHAHGRRDRARARETFPSPAEIGREAARRRVREGHIREQDGQLPVIGFDEYRGIENMDVTPGFADAFYTWLESSGFDPDVPHPQDEWNAVKAQFVTQQWVARASRRRAIHAINMRR